MGSRFNDAPLDQYQDSVAILHRGESMGNDQSGAVLHQFFQGILDHPFTDGVHGTGGFVHDQDGGVECEHAGDAQQLSFAGGQVAPPFGQQGIESIGQAFDEGEGSRLAGGGVDGFPTDAVFVQVDVLGDGAGKQEGFLLHHADQCAQGAEGIMGNREVIDEYLTAEGFVDAVDQLDQAGFTGTCGADDGAFFARGNGTGKVVDDQGIAITKINLVKADFPLKRGQGVVMGGVANGGRGVQQVEDALQGGHGGLHGGELAR